jgi:hypothetical protein
MSGKWGGGKGDSPRKADRERYALGHDLAYGNKTERTAARKRLAELDAERFLKIQLDKVDTDGTLDEEDDDTPSMYRTRRRPHASD